MRGFILRRIGASLLVLLVASVLIFLGVRALPGDPALALAGEDRSAQGFEEIRAKYGLDDPVPVQYVRWLGQVVQGDLGTSVRTGLDVRETIVDRLPITLELAALSILVALAIGSPRG
jgi:peptide/nickel transport system permease protein